MRIFAQKRDQTQDPVSSRPARPNGAKPGRDPSEQPVHLLRRTVAALRVLSQATDGLTVSPDASPEQESDRARRPSSLSALLPPNLVIGHVQDPLEQEADRVADRVMRMLDPEPSVSPAAPPLGGPSVERQAGEQVSALRAKHSTTASTASSGVPALAPEALSSPGQPLDASVRAYFEPRFGYDFSRVQVHTGEKAVQSADALDALAYTVGDHIVFGRGQYTPETHAGRHLLAHELAHVVQGAVNPAIVRRQPRFGGKSLTTGVMTWVLGLAEAEQTETGKTEKARRDIGKDTTYARMQIRFLPNAAYKGQTVTFLQTVLQVKEDGAALLSWLAGARNPKTRLDVLPDDLDPFYGATFAPKDQKWQPEGAAPGFDNAPSSAQNPMASLFDEPTVSEGSVKLFESVAVVAETGERLGALRWGIGKDELYGAQTQDCTDAPSADMSDALKRFNTPRKQVGDSSGQGVYDAIVDGFAANDGVAGVGPWGMVFSPVQKAAILTADQEKQLDPLIKWVKDLSQTTAKVQLWMIGFADPTETDVYATSKERVGAVNKYLVSEGVPAGAINALPFAAAWALYPSSVTEGRNRRVQIKVHFL